MLIWRKFLKYIGQKGDQPLGRTVRKAALSLHRAALYPGFDFTTTGEKNVVELAAVNGGVFLDVGANVGNWSIMASPILGESGKIYAFEPNPTIFKTLSKKVRNKRNIEIFDIGIGHLNEKKISEIKKKINIKIKTI